MPVIDHQVKNADGLFHPHLPLNARHVRLHLKPARGHLRIRIQCGPDEYVGIVHIPGAYLLLHLASALYTASLFDIIIIYTCELRTLPPEAAKSATHTKTFANCRRQRGVKKRRNLTSYQIC